MICSKCRKEFSEKEFSINPKTGEYYKTCNSCLEWVKEYREKNKDKIKEYYEQNKDKRKEYTKKYYEQNKDKILEHRKEYREQNKDKLKEYSKEYTKKYYEQNKDKILEYRKEYREQNRNKIKEYKKEYSKKYNNSNSLYKKYKDKLIGVDYKSDEEGYLLVRCKYCNKWFYPSNKSVENYIQSGNGARNLYCSEGCKKSCPSYKVIKYERGYRKNTSREVQPELRKLVLERDNWTCQKCGKSKDEDINLILHCHHIDPVKNNPIESADMDNCVTLCKECHKEVHRIKHCRYSDLANCSSY